MNSKGYFLMAQNFKRPKPDHLLNDALHGDAVADSIHYSIMPVDEIAARLELKWGCDRLPGLVSPDTASRFGSAKAKLDTGIQDNDPAAVKKRAAVMVKGWKIMDEEATAAGHQPLMPEVWSHTTQSGFKFAISPTTAEAIKSIRTDEALKGIPVFSLEEVGSIMESQNLVNVVKKTFPESRIKTSKKRSMDDEIPF